MRAAGSAGSRAGKQRGAADDRHLWPHMLRVINECRPTWIIGENVPGIIKMELDNCISGLEGIGYAVQAFTVPACAVDAKHRRGRLWIVAHADEPRPQGRDGAKLPERAEQRTSGAGDSRQDNAATWLAEPAVGRVANGIPHRAHRIKGLGNAIVPQVAAEFCRWIAQIERGEIA